MNCIQVKHIRNIIFLQERCLGKDDTCPTGYYYDTVSPKETGTLKPLAGKSVCKKCHPKCKQCTSFGFHIHVRLSNLKNRLWLNFLSIKYSVIIFCIAKFCFVGLSRMFALQERGAMRRWMPCRILCRWGNSRMSSMCWWVQELCWS